MDYDSPLLLVLRSVVLSPRIYILRESIVVVVAKFGDVHPVKYGKP